MKYVNGDINYPCEELVKRERNVTTYFKCVVAVTAGEYITTVTATLKRFSYSYS